VQLTTEPGGNYQPAWSPDGKRIAFMSTRAGKGDIYLISADGSDEKLITLPYGAQTPSWSPDGKQLAVARGGPQSPVDLPGLWLMNPDGTNLRQITHDLSGSPPFWSDVTPAWSPDGTTIVFSRQTTRNYRDLFVVKVDGSGLTQLTVDRGATHPTWSPDGDQIAFSAVTGYCDYDELDDCSSKILTMPAKGGAASVVATGFDPSWRRR
jgi:TolB protein